MPKWYMAEQQIDYNLINLDMRARQHKEPDYLKINYSENFQAWWMTAQEFRYSKAVPSFSHCRTLRPGKSKSRRQSTDHPVGILCQCNTEPRHFCAGSA